MEENKSNSPNSYQTDNASLILFNDQVNTFPFVITALIDICNHDEIQAEQLAILAHYNGSVVIKTGEKESLNTMKEQFSDAGLNVEIVAD